MASPKPMLKRTWVLTLNGAAVILGLEALYYSGLSSLLSVPSVGGVIWVARAHSQPTSVFAYLLSVLYSLTGDWTTALYYAGTFVFFALPLVVFLFLWRFVRNWEVSIVGSVLTLFYAGYLLAIVDASFGTLLGFAFLFGALYFGVQSVERFSEVRLLWFFLLASGAAFSDPNLGLILTLTLLPDAAVSYGGGRRTPILTPVLAAVPTLIAWLVSGPGPALQWEVAGAPVVYLAAAITAFALVLNRRDYTRQSLLFASFGMIATGVSFLTGSPYAAFVFIPLSSTIALKMRRVAAATTERGQNYLEFDLAKVASVVLLGTILVANFLASAGVAQSAASQNNSILNEYGNQELSQATTWLQEHTPTGAVVLAEYPLSQWVQAFGDRPSVTNLNLNPSSPNFQASYDADTILNATYEMRNGFFRVRDWAPVAPQRSPELGISNGTEYNNFMYIDENHFNLLNTTGYPISVAYSNVTKVFSGFTTVNGTTALVQRYLMDGVSVERDVTLGTSSQATITYKINSTTSGKISGAQVTLWIPFDRRIGYTVVGSNQVLLYLDVGQVNITSSGPKESFLYGPDKVYGQPSIATKFNSTASYFSFSFVVQATNVTPVSWSQGFEAVTVNDLIAKYKISFAVIPITVKARQADIFGTNFPTFQSVFQNDKLTIYKVQVSGQ